MKIKGWTFDEIALEATCPHGNLVEVDGWCWEEDCVNPLVGRSAE